ncbi:hypothetical protein YC2023_055004 [Brassica napus]
MAEIDSTSDKSPIAFYFVDISPGPSDSGLRFSLIHFWEAKNTAKTLEIDFNKPRTKLEERTSQNAYWRRRIQPRRRSSKSISRVGVFVEINPGAAELDEDVVLSDLNLSSFVQILGFTLRSSLFLSFLVSGKKRGP